MLHAMYIIVAVVKLEPKSAKRKKRYGEWKFYVVRYGERLNTNSSYIFKGLFSTNLKTKDTLINGNQY